jgi:hypothetical protein
MAYFSKEMKAKIAPKIKTLLKEYNMKGSLAVENHSAVALNLRSGSIDFGKDYVQINVYHVDTFFSGKAKEFLQKALDILNAENYDNSDAMTDYFDVGYYVRINVGRWDRIYEVTSAPVLLDISDESL